MRGRLRGGCMKKSGLGYVLLTAVVFSTLEPVSKLMAGQMNALALTSVRFLIGAVVLLPFALGSIRRNSISLNRRDFLIFTLQGVLCVCVSMGMLQMAVYGANSPALIAVIFSSNSVFTIAFAALLLKEKITPVKLGALALCVLGVVAGAGGSGAESTMVILEAVGSALGMSLFTVLGKRYLKGLTPEVQTGLSFLVGSAAMMAALAVAGVNPFGGLSVGNLPLVGYLGVAVTGLGYWSYFKAMEHAGAFMASFVFFIKPVLAPLAALAVLGTASVGTSFYISIALVLGGSLLMMWERWRALRRRGFRLA